MRKSKILLCSILIMVTASSCTQQVREEGDESNISADPRESNSRDNLPRHFFYHQR